MANTKKNETHSFDVNVLLKKEDDLFVAHCLEFDIVAVAETEEQAKKDLKDLVVAQIEYAFANDNLENLFHPAPKSVWEEYFGRNESNKNSQTKTPIFTTDLIMKTYACIV